MSTEQKFVMVALVALIGFLAYQLSAKEDSPQTSAIPPKGPDTSNEIAPGIPPPANELYNPSLLPDIQLTYAVEMLNTWHRVKVIASIPEGVTLQKMFGMQSYQSDEFPCLNAPTPLYFAFQTPIFASNTEMLQAGQYYPENSNLEEIFEGVQYNTAPWGFCNGNEYIYDVPLTGMKQLFKIGVSGSQYLEIQISLKFIWNGLPIVYTYDMNAPGVYSATNYLACQS